MTREEIYVGAIAGVEGCSKTGHFFEILDVREAAGEVTVCWLYERKVVTYDSRDFLPAVYVSVDRGLL